MIPLIINSSFQLFGRFGKDFLGLRIALKLMLMYSNYHCIYVFDFKKKGINSAFVDMLLPLLPDESKKRNSSNKLVTSLSKNEGSVKFYNGSRLTFVNAGDGGNVRGLEINSIFLSEIGFYKEEASNFFYSAALPAWKISAGRSDIRSFIFCLTTPGPSEFAWNLYNSCKHDNSWYVIDIPITEVKDHYEKSYYTDKELDEIRDGIPLNDYKREFLVNWDFRYNLSATFSFIFSAMRSVQKISFSIIPSTYIVHAAVDIGFTSCCIFFSYIDGQFYIVDILKLDDARLDLFLTAIKNYVDKNKFIFLGNIIFPYDANNRFYDANEFRSRPDFIKDKCSFWSSVVFLNKTGSISGDIDFIFKNKPVVYFNESCSQLVSHLQKWNLDSTGQKNREYSHFADAFRYMFMAVLKDIKSDNYVSSYKRKYRMKLNYKNYQAG